MGVERANTLEKEDFFLGRSRLQSNFSEKRIFNKGTNLLLLY